MKKKLLILILAGLMGCDPGSFLYNIYCPYRLSHSPDDMDEGEEVTFVIEAPSLKEEPYWSDLQIEWEADTDTFYVYYPGNSAKGKFRRGNYSFTVTILDENGFEYIIFDTLTVQPLENLSPHALFSVFPWNPSAGESISFSADPSFDQDGTIVSYAWDFGDGTTNSHAQATHSYASAGSYNVSLSVTDNYGDCTTTILSIEVKEAE